ncbi:MAG: DUF305 domain-containing protein [Pseudomonadales bacterium]|nr:DUF305 domain-containing protein [Pseudomonadales bacterium]
MHLPLPPAAFKRLHLGLAIAALMSLTATNPVLAQTTEAQPRIVQPGAPGQASRQISVEEASDLANLGFTDADVKFMQDMIVHHLQAVEMTALVAERSSNETVKTLAERITLSQDDEISMMRGWLAERNQAESGGMAHHGDHLLPIMPGMVSAEEMAELATVEGGDFDVLFLKLMIRHHEGAITMVENLLDQPGSAQDSVLFEFTNEVTSDQQAEIERMLPMLAGLSNDPRAGLKAGYADAGEASMNLNRLASLPKPDGFFDPDNPQGLPMSRVRQLAGETEPQEADEEDEEAEPRPSLLNFANTDIAFAGNLAVAGNYHGFNLYNIDNPVAPELLGSVVCPGGQGDVSVVGDLLIMSVEQTRGRLDCGLQGVAESVSEERFRGIRIFDISDISMPQQVAAVQTCRGSHTHTIVTEPNVQNRIYIYNSGTSSVRPEEELEGCLDESPFENPNTARFRIDIIEIPLDNPENSRIVNRPFIFSDPDSGVLAGLWEGGDHGPETQRTGQTNHCHDITAFPEIGLAAGACSGNGILLDISDPVNPVRIDQVIDSGFAYWHSATFNNDGSKVLFTDEWGGGSRPRCRPSDPLTWGADAIYDIVDGKLEFRSYYKMPAPQSDKENCVAHNGSLIPVPGRDIMAQAWYQGGISIFDFTDSSNPVEIAYFDRGPVDEEHLILGGYWSAYWHEGKIFATEIARGLDVFELTPSDYLSANEIAAASFRNTETLFNPQLQRRIQWPAEPVVARAYLDQLRRIEAIASNSDQAISALLTQTEQRLTASNSNDRDLATQLLMQAGILDQSSTAGKGLATTLEALAERLR